MKLFNFLLASVCVLSLGACKAESTAPKTSTQEASTQTASTKGTSEMTAKITELQKIDTQVGTGREAEPGFNVTVHYTGWLYDAAAEGHKGKKFDSSLDRKQPFVFFLGGGQVIQGWDEGFAGMKIGGKRTLVIPSEMGYGARGAGGAIPPNADLIFDVELLDVK
ncbi:FKBP-type peptidyl-prolyl cis-trans isomerase [Methylotenera versatilis]|jgi:FKBP-type peptidyl-prolyl cis-trans isomerase FkpA|uniref:Peptidyl-prolyl cis-trans isomerase n=1 Tax=Methylotenera versatilis (strain 301) TaxID=666681 RepID=D7DM95_METV0|nr:FKBP-type peptidyl-prolyl cis-trans isomerase [Methylotenera versatilis]ADI28806.1 Peptidylprolyl isomerase [Methylotenera versatilis 301]